MNSQEFDAICDCFTGKQRDRALKICSGNEIPEQEVKLFYSNLLIGIKFKLRNWHKCTEHLSQQAYQARKISERAEKEGDIVKAAEYISRASEFREKLKPYNDLIIGYGKALMDLCECIKDTFTDHEIAQIISASYKHIKECREWYDGQEREEKGHGFFFDALFIYGAEYRGDYKGKLDGVYDCKMYEMPFYWAQAQWFFNELDNNKALKNVTDKFIYEELGLKDHAMYLKQDIEGRIVGAEKIVDEITVQDLMQNYSDTHTEGVIDAYIFAKDLGVKLDLQSKVRIEQILGYEIKEGAGGRKFIEADNQQFEYIDGMLKVTDLNKNFLGFVIKKAA